MAQSDDFLAAYNKVYGAPQDSAGDPFMSAYRKVYGEEAKQAPSRSSDFSNFARGVMLGLGTAGTSTVGAIGTLTRSKGLQDWSRRSEEEMRGFYDPQGRAGAWGTRTGRGFGELATGIVGGGLGVKAAGRLIPKVGQALQGASRAQRAAAITAGNLPIDIVQGAKEEEGLVLPGRAGAIAENIGLTGIGAALTAGRRATQTPVPEPPRPPEAPRALPSGQYDMGGIPERKLLPPGPPVPEPITASAEDIARYRAARNRGVTIGRSGQTMRRPAEPRPSPLAQALDEAEIERAAIQAEEAAGVASSRFPRNLSRMSDPDLRATTQAWLDRMEQTSRNSMILNETDGLAFGELMTRPVGYRRAKALFGTKEDGRRYAKFSEEQIGRLEELNLTPEDIQVWHKANADLPRLQGQADRLMTEMERRGLSIVDEATEFPFGANRPGVIAPELLAQGGGALTGAAIGVGTAPEDEDVFGLGGRAVLGGLAGLGLGRAAMRGLPSAGSRIGQRPPTGFPERTTPLGQPVQEAEQYANIGRMTSEAPEMAEGLRETVRGAVKSRQLGERLPRQGQETLGRFVEAETEDILKERVAKFWGGKPSDIVARTAKGERVGRERLLRATEELLERQNTINNISERLRSGLVIDAQEVRRLEALRDAEREAAYDLFSSISTQKTEIARDLAAMRFGVALSDNPIVWKERLEELAKRPLTADEIARAESLAMAKDIEGLTRFGTQIRKSTPMEKAIALYKASLLTSPKTHVANLAGNTGMGALRQVRDVMATFADMGLAAITGQRTKVMDLRSRWQAIQRGAAQGFEDGKRVLSGDLPAANKFREIREVNYDNAIANIYTKGIFRGLDASDRVFRGLAFAESIAEQAQVLAKNSGLKGQAAQEFVDRMIKSPTVEMTADAILAADNATFQQTGALSRAALKVRDSLGAFGQLVFPFVKTPTNIAQTIVNYSPLGLAGSQFGRNLKSVLRKEATSAQQRMVAERIGEVSTGSALLLLGYLKGKKGEMTGFYPADERGRAQWEAEGKLEGAVKVGKDWVQVNRISPIGNLLSIGAAMADLERGNPDVLSVALGSVAAPLSAITELPMTQGLANLQETIDASATPEQREAALLRLGGGMVAGAIPFSGLLRSIQQAQEPMVPETRTEGRVPTMLRRVGAGIPGVAQSLELPAKIDPLGRPIERGGTAFERFVSPFQRRTDITEIDPVQRALAEANAVVGRVDRRKNETPQAYAERAQRTGELVRRRVAGVVQSPAYERINTMNVDRLRRGLTDAGVETEGLSDDEIRNAWRRVVLDRVIRRAKSVAAKAQPERISPTIRQLRTAVER